MPLKSGKSQKVISENIRELHHGPNFARTEEKHGEGTAHRQAIAIAMETARKSRAKGGKVHVGPINGDAPGRVDVHKMQVEDGGYVISSDVISHLGQNNSAAGLKLAQHLFGEGGKYDTGEEVKSAGGKATGTGKPVDCITAGGEFVISPRVTRAIGKGDIDLGHKILDKWSMDVRKDHVETLKNLPPPARD